MKYWAFISYSHSDKSWGDWLHRSLETWRPPRALLGRPGRDGPVTKKNPPVFRDREELPSSASLADNINDALRESRYLIAICSPRSAASRWVNEEIRYYKSLGREDRVLCLIVDGEPNASDKPESGLPECFPPAVRFHVGADGALTEERTEPIAADARTRGDGRERAKLKLLAGLLGVNFDDLVRREARRQRWRRIRLGALAAVAFGAGVWWWLQPGILRVQVQPPPPGARIAVDGREQSVNQRVTEFQLRAGDHTIKVLAPNFDESERTVTLERRQTQEIHLELRHEQGKLDVEVDPDDARIEVDGHPFGSRIEALPFDTGEHLVRALRADRYERTDRVTVRKGDTARVFLSLSPAVKAWSIERWDVQGGFVNVGDVDGDGVDDFAHNFITEVAVISGRTGEILRHFPTRDGNLRPFSGANLGGAVGRVALSSGTRNVRDTAGAWMTDVLCIKGGDLLWKWTGPAPRVGNAMTLAVGDLNGDGVSEIAVFSISDDAYIVDGATGKMLRSVKFGVTEWSNAPWLSRCPTSDGEGIFFCGVPIDGGLTYGWGKRTVRAGLLLIKDGRLAWKSDYPGVLTFRTARLADNAPRDLVLTDEQRWRVIDSSSGVVKFEGAFPRSDGTRELIGFWFAKIGEDNAVCWIMGFLPGVVERAPLLAAVRLRDGSVIWRRDDLQPLAQQTVDADGRLIRASDGGIVLRLENGLVDLDPMTGVTRWQQPISTGQTSGFVSDAREDQSLYLGEVGRGIRALGLDGSPRWGVWFSREYSPMIALPDWRIIGLDRLILNHHDGTEKEKCEIACVLPPSRDDWDRSVIPANPLPQTPRGGAPMVQLGEQPLVIHILSQAPGVPDLVADDAVSGVRIWQARELFKPDTALAAGPWGSHREEAVAAIGQLSADAIGARSALFVYRARDGARIALVPIEPWGDFSTDATIAALAADSPTDYVAARKNLLLPDGTRASGDVFAIGSADGKRRWRRELPEPTALSVAPRTATRDAVVMVRLADGSVRALAGNDGHELWGSPAEVAAFAPIMEETASGGTEAIAVSEDGQIRFLDIATGRARDAIKLSDVGQIGTATLRGKHLYLSSSKHGIIAVDTITNKELWRESGNGTKIKPVATTLDQNGREVIVQCATDGHITVCDSKSGEIVSEMSIPSAPARNIAWLPAGSKRPQRVFVTCEDGVLRSRVLSPR
jgi:outer membrane protein assembly factor BamB